MAMPVQQYTQMEVRKVLRETQYREKVPTSPAYSADRKSAAAKKEYYIPTRTDGKHVLNAFKDFLGYSAAIKDGGGNTTGISRVIPHEIPEPADFLFAERIQDMKGDVALGEDDNEVAYYDECLLQVGYATFPFKHKTDLQMDGNGEASLQRYVSIKVDPAGRYEKIPAASGMKWATDLAPMNNSAAVILCESDVTITWYQIPIDAVPNTAINACMGKVDSNNGVIIEGLARFQFLASTYMGPVLRPALGGYTSQFLCMVPKYSEPYPMVNGGYAIDIVYHFKFYPYGANNFYRWDRGRFELAVTSNGTAFFPPANFNTLFWGV